MRARASGKRERKIIAGATSIKAKGNL